MANRSATHKQNAAYLRVAYMTALIVCMRFSACWNTRDRLDSNASSSAIPSSVKPRRSHSERSGVAVPVDRGGRPAGRAPQRCLPADVFPFLFIFNPQDRHFTDFTANLPQTVFRPSKREYLPAIHLSSRHTFRPSAYKGRRVIKTRERAAYLRRRPDFGHTFCPITHHSHKKKMLRLRALLLHLTHKPGDTNQTTSSYSARPSLRPCRQGQHRQSRSVCASRSYRMKPYPMETKRNTKTL